MTNNPVHSADKLLVAMELSNSKWVLAFYNGEKYGWGQSLNSDILDFSSNNALYRPWKRCPQTL
ncbi:MAG: hypothetical protein H8E68_09330 [Kiritimatiellaeota bacterium]|nr:hypothetical protein [Kiritimatiellota bacterium]